MREILITSSVLIAALVLLRVVFRTSIPRRVQYGLWALVLLRLLIPVELPALPISVLNAAQGSRQAVEAAMEAPVYVPPADRLSPQFQSGAGDDTQGPSDTLGSTVVETEGEAKPAASLTTAQALTAVWIAGMAGMAFFFLAVNLRFRRRLVRSRTPFPAEGCPLPVYLCRDLPSPCLVGLFRPAIYLTPAAAEPGRLRHVLLHEETHARHGDPLWSLLRCLCLTIYWFDPLVWAAAILSQRDCELACDEGVLLRLESGERLAYGQTLLALVPVKGPANPVLAATTMTAGKRQMKDRITRIARAPRPAVAAVLAAVLLAAMACACTFTGSQAGDSPDPVPSQDQTPVAAEPTVYPDWAPERTIPLDGLTPYEATVLAVERHSGDCDVRLNGHTVGDYEVRLYLSTDGNYYAAVVYDQALENGAWTTWEAGCFLTLPSVESGYTMDTFSHLFGYSGVILRHTGQLEDGSYMAFEDYYTVTEEGTPLLLARAYGSSCVVDLDGDGVNELLTERQVFFQRDGVVFEADLAGLMATHWPELTQLDYTVPDPETRSLLVVGTVAAEGWYATAFRYLYFDGEKLLLYRDQRQQEDHMLAGAEAPEEVLSRAQWQARACFEAVLAGGPEAAVTGQGFDDWCITQVRQVELSRTGWQWDGPAVEVYHVSFQLHTAQPGSVVQAGGIYVEESGWVGGFNSGYSPYLVAVVQEDGTRLCLDSAIPFDCTEDSQAFLEGLTETLRQAGYETVT